MKSTQIAVFAVGCTILERAVSPRAMTGELRGIGVT
jgi:hypothetical protein